MNPIKRNTTESTIITENAIVDIFMILKVERFNDGDELRNYLSHKKIAVPTRIQNEFRIYQNTGHFKLMEITREDYPKP